MANETLEQLGNALEAAQQKIGAVAEEVSEQAYNELVAIRREKLRGLQEAGNDPFELTSYPQADFAAEVKESFVDVPEGEQGRSVCMAGRMMSKRVMGKASFADLRDTTGNIQLYVRRDDVGVEEYQAFKKFDIGDIIGVRGFVFRTKMGEISVHVTEIVLLSKSLLPLPEKFHGLKDREARYRQRYVDLIVNPEVRKTFEVRSKFIRHMRNYLDERGYMEVETPVLNTIAGGAAARPFVTHHNTLDIDMYMRIATELPLKRLIVGGIDRVYEIGRIFRNEGMDPKHNPEFTTVELYQAYADFHTMMDIAEGILSSAALELLGGYEVEWLGEKIDLTPGWRRLTMVDAVKEYAGIDFGAISDNAQAVAAAEAIGVELPDTKEQLREALAKLLTYGDHVVVEKKIKGREIQIAVLGDTYLPAVEIIPRGEYFDYVSKYQKGGAQEICPAPITEEEWHQIGEMALKLHRGLGLSVYSRSDFLLDEEGKAWCLEINTLPGMTPTSLVPQEAAQVGLSYADLCERIVEESLKARGVQRT